MAAITVRFYKTIDGQDRLIATRQFKTVGAAVVVVDQWENLSPDHYAVYGKQKNHEARNSC